METRTTEDQLRAEIDALKRELAGRKPAKRGPSAATLTVLGLLTLALIAGGFILGYLPRQRREEVLAAESTDNVSSLPQVNFTKVERSANQNNLALPGNIQAVTETPILARATGYIRKRYVDIGDRVKAAQVVAEIDAPELDQQILQANATIEQIRSQVQQADAALQQGKANENLAKVTAGRYENLFNRG